ncbi:MAG: ABC transporter permease [Demequinaceae bacterium]|nr:ABC transporter permease [Demequinaceae bacterium]
MRATTHKSIRDLLRQRAQVVAVGITIMLGVTLYVGSASAFQNLTVSYAYTYDRLSLADLTSTGGDGDAIAAAALAAGAEEAIARIQVDPPVLIDDTKLVGRVVGLPTNAHPTVNDVEVLTGSYFDPGATGQVLLERHAAETFGLGVGDTVEVFAGGSWHSLTVQGTVGSAEYVWPSRSRQEILADSRSFAILYVPEEAAEDWLGAPNQSAVLLPADASPALEDQVTRAMRAAGAVDVTTQEDQPSNAALHEDLKGFDEISVTLPLLFLSAASVAAYVMLSRRILQERPVIGTLMASGARRGRILRHYLAQGIAIGLIGSVVGTVAGGFLNGAITRAYTSAIGIPDTLVSNHPSILITGMSFGFVVGALGALAPALKASRTAPAEAMRSSSPLHGPGPWGRLVARLGRLPVTTRMALRDIGRSRRRTIATMIGTTLSLIIVLASVGLMTSMTKMLDVQFAEVQREDATVMVDATQSGFPQSLDDLADVTAVEPIVAGPVTAIANGRSYVTSVTGFDLGTAMHGFRTSGGRPIDLPADGVLAGVETASLLDVETGDTIVLATASGEISVTLAGFVDEPFGTLVYGSRSLIAPVLPDTGVDTYLVSFADGVDRDALRQTITQMPGIVSYADSQALVASATAYLGLFWAFVGVFIVLGVILAFALVYVTMAVSVVERTNELATLRAAGVPTRRVAWTIATENLAATALGLPFGLVLGVITAAALNSSFSSDLFRLDLVLGWWPLPAAALGVLVAAALSQWPAARAVRRIDVARIVRERAI